MEEHFLSTPRTARYFTLGTVGAQDLWLVLHGYSNLAARFLERFRPIASAERCIVAPEGLSRFYLTESPSERRVGASWMTREDRLHEIEDYVRYLDAVYTEVRGREDGVTVLGFSQGTATACRWTALSAVRVSRLIIWGGEVPPDLDLGQPVVAERLRAARLTLVYGTSDEYFTPKVVAATEARLKAADVPYELRSYEGGHQIDERVLRDLV
ncbi:MAG TPA: dienelactone hydrolase family protein [Gemmatimonadales bacterium]|jgi:predicted esterase|nr:dienelactone hydrolase family protein [Gemmatimonadales bacterium]